MVLRIVDKDKFTKDDNLGEVTIDLKNIDLNRKNPFVREIGPVTNILNTYKSSPSKSSSSRNSSYVEDGGKSPRKSAPGGPTMLRYRIDYDRGARNLVVRVIEARVRLSVQFNDGNIVIFVISEPQECRLGVL